jgi:hypothetical protein
MEELLSTRAIDRFARNDQSRESIWRETMNRASRPQPAGTIS